MRQDVPRTGRLAEELISQAANSSMRSYVAVARGHVAWCRMREGDTDASIDQAREAVRLLEFRTHDLHSPPAPGEGAVTTAGAQLRACRHREYDTSKGRDRKMACVRRH
jgi:hypothetical protein